MRWKDASSFHIAMLGGLYGRILIACTIWSSLAAAALQPVTDWGNAPTRIKMNVHAPSKVTPNAPLILLLHPCGGTARAYYATTGEYQRAADQKGYVLIYPETPFDSHCWDVASPATLRHNGGGDSQSLVNMVKYATRKYNSDPRKVYVTGTSSGAMMTNVLAGAYPDVFAGAAAFSGVGFGCLAGSRGSSPVSDTSPCTKGGVTKSGKQWGDQVRSAYPNYSGPRPKMQLWHGTADFIVRYHAFEEALKQWSDVSGSSQVRNVSSNPEPRYTKMVYGDGSRLVAYSASGVGHVVRQHPKQVMEFWGI